jgi:hypothetical protein
MHFSARFKVDTVALALAAMDELGVWVALTGAGGEIEAGCNGLVGN